MRGAYTGSLHAPTALATLRPTFSWAAVAPTCGTTTYEVQADDSCAPGALDTCTFPSPELDAKGIAGLSYSPAADLKVATTPPVGAFYAWRVRACDASTRCGSWSEVRYLHVGRVREDINGDGYGDLLAPSSRGIEVYFGASQFDVSAPSITIPDHVGATPTFSGDVNGDGFGDFFTSTDYTPSSGQVPTIYFGAPTLTAPVTLLLTKTAGGPSTLIQTNSAGDLNGDGFADLIVQWAYSITTPQTELRIFFGNTVIANIPDLSIPGPYVNAYTLNHSGRVGDLNGDGFEDIALTAISDGGSNGGLVQLFAGGPHPTATAVDIATNAATYQIESVGDVDRDGFDDALIVLAGTNYALYRGAATLPVSVAKTWTDTTTSAAAGGFDIDGDGFSDFLVGTNAAAPILYRGATTGPSAVLNGLSHLTGSSIVAFSDHDGDGRPDFIGMSSPFSYPSMQWAGSDGTTDPRAFIVRLPADVMLYGQLVR
ncbi:MAG TPA: VCBS repeat-containing protein [Polyangia bacterium]|nr:VCBS repeat-containing protein [Polyangia bacterium]